MSGFVSCKTDKEIYCEYKNEKVNIHILKHPILNAEYSRVCDYAVWCQNKKCEFKGEDE